MILSVEGPRADIAISGARALAEQLEGHSEIAWMRAGIEEGQWVRDAIDAHEEKKRQRAGKAAA